MEATDFTETVSLLSRVLPRQALLHLQELDKAEGVSVRQVEERLPALIDVQATVRSAIDEVLARTKDAGDLYSLCHKEMAGGANPLLPAVEVIVQELTSTPADSPSQEDGSNASRF